jgi:hypothetical protein
VSCLQIVSCFKMFFVQAKHEAFGWHRVLRIIIPEVGR